MRITSVTVGFGLTESLPDYGNVKPSVRLTADVEPGLDDVREVIDRLDRLARAYCEDAVDTAREGEDEKPKYYTGPLYRLCLWEQRGAVVIVPEDVNLADLPGTWKPLARSMRPETVFQRSGRLAKGREVWDFDREEALAWWEEREWYEVYELSTRTRESRLWDRNVGRVVVARHGLVIHEEMRRINIGPQPQSREKLIEELRRGDYREWVIIGDQESLDEIGERWLAEHPRPA